MCSRMSVEASASSTMKVPEAVRAIRREAFELRGLVVLHRGCSRPVEACAGLLGPLDDGRRPGNVQSRCPLDLFVAERALLVEAVPDVDLLQQGHELPGCVARMVEPDLVRAWSEVCAADELVGERVRRSASSSSSLIVRTVSTRISVSRLTSATSLLYRFRDHKV